MTLYGIIRDLLKSGDLTTRPSYHAQMGSGETLLFRGSPVRVITEVLSLRNFVPPEKSVDFDRPTDVLLDSENNVITCAAS